MPAEGHIFFKGPCVNGAFCMVCDNSCNLRVYAYISNGKINRNEQGIFLTYIEIKRLLDLPISDDEFKKEKMLLG